MDRQIGINYITELFPNGEVIEIHQGGTISGVHKKIEYIHWLISGTLKFSMSLGGDLPEVEVCQFSGEMFPVGWNGLSTPGRHTKNITVASPTATFYRVKIDGERTFLNTITDLHLQRHVCKIQFRLLKEAVNKQIEILPEHVFIEPKNAPEFEEVSEYEIDNVVLILKKSPFFEAFDDHDLSEISNFVNRRNYQVGELILKQDELSDGLYILSYGNVRIQRFGEAHAVSQWPIKHQGFVFGWSGFIDEEEFCTAQSTQNSSVYFIEGSKLQQYLKNNEKFALKWFTRLNWLVDNHINAAFVRYLSIEFNFDESTIRYLIEHYQTQIKASSDLHKIPHLLAHRTTKPLAYQILRQLVKNGSSRERRMASISLELLKNSIQENDFLQQLQNVYEAVTDQPLDTDAKKIRQICARETEKLTAHFEYKIVGKENLPDSKGNIFIYNHLVNHRYYTLNNNFQITLESHFISGVLLAPKYGDPGIRVVRIGRNKEFAHQNYYERMGYINVFTRESESTTKTDRDKSRNHFFDSAKAHLDGGNNLIISPEGTSYHTEDDIPGPFKSGAFRIALEMENEPYIVPIIILNFDKRIHEAVKYCEVLPPFKISEHPLYSGKENIEDFVTKYRVEFKQQLDNAKRTLQKAELELG